MPESNEIMSIEGQLVGMPLAGPESFSQQQLDYLKRALGLDETVLWSNASGSSSIALSEPMTNFELCRFKMKSDQGNHYDFVNKRVGNVIVLFFTHGDSNAWSTWLVLDYDTSTDTITVRHSKSLGHSFTSNSTTLSGAVDSYKDVIVEVVGIHRIAGGN